MDVGGGADIAGLSDLSREGRCRLTVAWPNYDVTTREAAVRRMGELVEERVDLIFGRALRVALDDASATIRQLAIAALWEDEGDDLRESLLRLAITDPSVDVRGEAVRALGAFADRAAEVDPTGDDDPGLRDALLALVAEPDTSYVVRRRALEAVGAFGGHPAVQSLIADAYAADDQSMRASALAAMGRSLNARWLPIVVAELETDEAELRFEAVRAAGLLGDDRIAPELAVLARDADAEVRFEAVNALGRVGGRISVRLLRMLAAEASNYEVELIEAALEEAESLEDVLRVGS